MHEYQENLLSKKIYSSIAESGWIGMLHLTLTEWNFAVLDEKKTASKCGLWAQSKDRENDWTRRGWGFSLSFSDSHYHWIAC